MNTFFLKFTTKSGIQVVVFVSEHQGDHEISSISNLHHSELEPHFPKLRLLSRYALLIASYYCLMHVVGLRVFICPTFFGALSGLRTALHVLLFVALDSALILWYLPLNNISSPDQVHQKVMSLFQCPRRCVNGLQELDHKNYANAEKRGLVFPPRRRSPSESASPLPSGFVRVWMCSKLQQGTCGALMSILLNQIQTAAENLNFSCQETIGLESDGHRRKPTKRLLLTYAIGLQRDL